MNSYEIIGTDPADMIREAMRKENVNQADLADQMGIRRQTVSEILTRNKRGMRFDSFAKFAEILGCEVVLRKKCE